jgi:hypothetical protein
LGRPKLLPWREIESRIGNLRARDWTRAWAITAGLVLLVHSCTLTLSPTIWQDEAQIVELGRTSLWERSTNWSPNWLPTGHAVIVPSYVGPALADAAFRLTCPSPAGPRLFSLLGALFAATILRSWLRRRGNSELIAWVLATAFLLDPTFVASYRGGRLDGWAIGWMLLACHLLRGVSTQRATSDRRRAFIWGGLTCAVGLFVWASAILLLPLVVLELVFACRSEDHPIASGALCFALAAFVAGVALALPQAPYWRQIAADAETISKATALVHVNTVTWLDNVLGLFATIRMSPLMWALTAAAACSRKSWLLAVTLACLLTYMLSTFAYGARLLYVLPVAVALLAERAHSIRTDSTWSRRVLVPAAVALILWGVGISLLARTANALAHRRARDPDAVLAAARDAIGSQVDRVYIGTWQVYYAGRALGWRMMRPYGSASDQDVEALAPSLKYALVLATPTPETKVLLHFLRISRELLPATMGHADFGAAPYGPYLLLTRKE